MHRKKLSLAVAQALSAGIFVGLSAPSAYAQQTPAPERIEKVTVTGTRIPSANLTSTSPITTISAESIKFEQPVSTENLMNNMPQVIADQGNFVGNGSTGTATVNLRGLGAARTLVLVNGRPLPPGTPANGGYGADVNEVPLQLIQRVEILTGGASAVYGSDAIAGVVNFIMNDRFEGVQFDISHSFYNHQQHSSVKDTVAGFAARNPSQFQVPGDVDSDGEVEDYSLTLGGNFAGGKGNATVFLGYHRQKQVTQDQRDFGACSLASTGSGFTCAGSGTSHIGKFTPQSGPNGGNAFTIANAAGDVRPFVGSTDNFNFNPFNYYQAPDDRWNVAAFAHYDVDPRARVYAEFGFHDSHSPRNIAPGADFGSINTLSFDNPLLSDSFKQTFGITPTNPVDFLIQRRNVEGGPRIFDFRTTSYRGVGGVKGEILGGWNYDLYYTLGRVVYSQIFKNDLSISRFTRALDVTTDPNTGQPVCRTVLNGADPACVPWDIFHTGGVTPAQINYIVTPAFQTGSTERRVYGATLGADLGMYGWRLPWAKDGIGVSFGAENGNDKLDLNTDVEFETGDVEGLPVHSNHGQIGRKEYFAEVRVPIIEDMPGAQYLAVNGSYRYSDYSINQTSNTYGVGVEWNPIKELKFRGSIQQSVRAPNVVELFLPQGLNLFNGQDPCGPNATTGAPPTASVAQCLRTGLPANLFGASQLASPAGQLQFLQGGNADLTPETGKSYTVGAVWQPTRNLSASVDYYKIKVANVISTIPSALALSQCIDNGTFCDLIHRDAQGTLWLPGQGFITGTNINIAKLETSGVDVVANYVQPLPGAWGNLAFEFTGTWLKDFKFDSGAGLGPYDCVGLYGPVCNGNAGIAINPLAQWRHKVRGTWSTPWNVDLSATWRHIDSVSLDAFDSNPQLFNADLQTPEEHKLGARDYLDLALSWAMTKQFTLWAGVNNIFDTDPPLAGTSSGIGPTSSATGNTFPQMYDPLGRRIFISLTAKF
jgi:outer membrane receptor protein involved in Fe transport